MISGFALFADRTTQPIDSFDGLRAARAREDSVIWLDLGAAEDADLRELDAVIHLDAAALDDCLQGEQRPRIDEFEDYLFLVLYGLLGLEDQEFAPRKLAAFIGPRFLITIHREPLRTIKSVIGRCARNPSKMLSNGVDAVLFHIIDGMVDKYLFVGERYEEHLEDLEDRSLEPVVDDAILAESGALRRGLLELRRLAVSQRELIAPLAEGQFDSISDSLEPRFRHVADHLNHVVDVADGIRERMNTVRDNYHASLASRTNATMQTLTLMAAIMLPMSVIAGIYGMNVPVWPPGDRPLSFWAVLGLMALVSGVLLACFRRRRWI